VTNFLCSSFIVISIGGGVPWVLLYWLGLGLYAIHLACEVVRDGEVERRRVERDVVPTKPRPTVPRRIDPSDLIEMAHILQRAQIRSLSKKFKHEQRRAHALGSRLAHFADSTETRPSFGPSFSRMIECDHLRRMFGDSYGS
jgi:hypothetical protein